LEQELECLALNIYFEARNEPSEGRAAVGHVVLNRVSDSRFPDTVCKVVRQGGEQVRHRCQFSWWCDGLSDRPKNLAVWETSKAMAGDVYWGRSEDPTNGALWYHADYVMPYWGRVYERGPKIGRHIFYHGRKQRTQVAANQ
jgi:spore germination cell wall hydrolase CwlJ-like protein